MKYESTRGSKAYKNAPQAIIRGIKAILNPEDGYYHEDLGKDAEGNQIYGSIVYAYFAGGTVSFSNALADVVRNNPDGTTTVIPGLISLGSFDFSKNEYDDEETGLLDALINEKERIILDLNAQVEGAAVDDIYNWKGYIAEL